MIPYTTIGHHIVYTHDNPSHNPSHCYSLWYDSAPFRYWIMTSTNMKDIHRTIAIRRTRGLT